jgi:hypothetical protein
MKSDVKVLSDAANLYNIEHAQTWPLAWTDANTNDEFDEGEEDAATNYNHESALGIALGLEAGESVDVYNFDGAMLDEYVKGLSGDIADYGLVADGDFEGEVFHLTGVEARDGNIIYGTNTPAQ